eukprot:IDg6467t1
MLFPRAHEAADGYLNPSVASYDKGNNYALAQRLALEGLWDHSSLSAVAYWPSWPTQSRAGRTPATACATS